MNNRFKVGSLMAASILLPLLANGCSSDPASNPLCCNEFKVGAEVDAKIGGSAQSQIAVQAIADLGAIGASAVADLTTSCKAIAQDLDAPQAGQDGADGGKDANERMKAWCTLAAGQIVAVKGKASLKVDVTPAVCSANISAKADCQAKCTGSASCDFKANPPVCTGGKLEVSCKGECTAKAGATLTCTGKCSGTCKGSCTSQGGIKCAGKCEGTCEGAGGAGTSGVDAQGNCQGTCKGTCSATAPSVTCDGTCSGECSASCTGTAEASVKCDGECKADYEPLQCTGGKLEGGCKADAKCEGSCDASVSAKASCTPPAVNITFSGDVQAAGKLQATLKANLPLIFGIKGKLDLAGTAVGSVTGNISAVADIKAACIPPLVAAAAAAGEDFTASISATASIAGAIK
jgi:hypothetical protein